MLKGVAIGFVPHIGRDRRRRLGAAAVVALGVGAAAAGAARADFADTTNVRFEVGAGSDFTNELFYEDAFVDTTFLGRRRVDTPEWRASGLFTASLDGTRGRRTTRYTAVADLGLGDRLSRASGSLQWRTDPTPDDRVVFDPRAEYRRDRTLGRDLEEWRASAGARYRRAFPLSGRSLEFGGRGERVRASGTGSDFVLDRNAGSVLVGLDQTALERPEWRLGYRFTARQFPDSTERDHFEHSMEARWRTGFDAPATWVLELEADRRTTVRVVPTSRDNFWEQRAGIEGEGRSDASWTWRARLEAEAIQYDVEDSTLFFDYQQVRVAAGPRLAGSATWSVWVAARGEALFCRLNPGEAYREVALAVDAERFAGRSWWSATPAAGWREYDDDPALAALGLGALHSPFAFYELTLHGDQDLPGRLRLRALVHGRLERHEDESQDAGSLYFSLDVRRLF